LRRAGGKILPRPEIVAMWSGPRNLSTAMMRSFAARSDCRAIDEPFYAAYLSKTGLNHPMRNEVIAAGETDPEKVVELCLRPPEPPASLVYQKHMTHHMIEGFDTGWLAHVTNVFLIRDPARVLASYAVKAETVTPADTGFARQRALFDSVAETTGHTPAVIDAADIRANPASMLERLCKRIAIAFDPAMLSWEPGPRPEDGVWASHWYDAVWKSTGFAPPETGPAPVLPRHLAEIEEILRPDYDYMRGFRITR
jgi:Sulfotransferase domain